LEDILSIERTLVLVKPNGVARGLSGEIIARFERRGFALKGLKLVQVSRDLAEEHYQEHRDKDFFCELVTFLTSGPVVAIAVEGVSAVRVARDMMGATDPTKAAPGTIRGDFALEIGENVVHGSDSVESGRREIALYFSPEELLA
jgi:nucleoside-diphosphate kinase